MSEHGHPTEKQGKEGKVGEEGETQLQRKEDPPKKYFLIHLKINLRTAFHSAVKLKLKPDLYLLPVSKHYPRGQLVPLQGLLGLCWPL